jgi:hypothetical protein
VDVIVEDPAKIELLPLLPGLLFGFPDVGAPAPPAPTVIG